MIRLKDILDHGTKNRKESIFLSQSEQEKVRLMNEFNAIPIDRRLTRVTNQNRIENVEHRNAADQLIDDRQEIVKIDVVRLASVSFQVLEIFQKHVEGGEREESEQESEYFEIENPGPHAILDKPSANHSGHIPAQVEARISHADLFCSKIRQRASLSKPKISCTCYCGRRSAGRCPRNWCRRRTSIRRNCK